jgi:hypothetical protein
MSKVDKIKEKYKGSITSRTFNALNEGDTTPTKKYLDYMCNQWISVRNSTTVVKTVMEFDSLLPYIENKDIYSSTYDSFFDLMVTITKARELKEEKSFNRDEHVNVIYEDDSILLVSPKTHRGSLKYGANTKWCTASKDYPGHFNRYQKDGYLFYLIRKIEKGTVWDKVAFYKVNKEFTSNIDIFSSKDTEISGTSLIKKSDWDVSTLMHVHLLIEAYILQSEIVRNAKDYVGDIIQSISNIDMNRLNSMITILESSKSSGTLDEFKTVTAKLKDILDSVKS